MIRKANRKDVKQVALLFNEYRIFYRQAPDITAAEGFLEERVEKNESVIFVAEGNDKILGFTQLYPIFSSVGLKRAWLLNDLFVMQGMRGKGIADALLRAAQEFGKQTNSRWLLLQTAVNNYAAQKVYERNGWKREEGFYTYQFYPAP